MNDIKVYIKVDPSKGLPKEERYYHTSIGDIKFCDGEFLTTTPEFYFQPISLTELMVGFAEWCALNAKSIKYKDNVSWSLNLMKSEYGTETEKLLEIYMESKGIVL